MEARRVLAVVTVDTLEDNISVFPVDNGEITLREAIDYISGTRSPGIDDSNSGNIVGAFAKDDPSQTDTIIFANGLSGEIDLRTGSSLDIRRPLTIVGPGSSQLTVDGAANTGESVLLVDVSAGEVAISGLTFTGGSTTLPGGGIAAYNSLLDLDDVTLTGNSASNGGGLSFSGGALTIKESLITGNTASSRGGGLFSSSFSSDTTVTIENSSITLNSAVLGGGGIDSGANLAVRESVVSGNTASGSGAGINQSAGTTYLGAETTVVIERTTIDSNIATADEVGETVRGGGFALANQAPATITILDSTLSRNEVRAGATGSVAEGGGIAVDLESGGSLRIEQSTVSGNIADTLGGGLWQISDDVEYLNTSSTTLLSSTLTGNVSPDAGGILATEKTILRNTIIAGNRKPDLSASNISGDVSALSAYNLLATGGDGGLIDGLRGNHILGTNDPLLGPLDDNGGLTETHLPGSPAIDVGDPAGRYDESEFDQRGAARVLGGRVDIGAVESIAPVIDPPNLASADVVFVLDRTGSIMAPESSWIADAALSIDSELALLGYTENRYGLVGFGWDAFSNQYGFSNLIDGELFGTAEETAEVALSVATHGEDEDGWDGIEHAIAEYQFREGASVHIVLLTDDQRDSRNDSLTQDSDPTQLDAILPLLASRNATFTVVAQVDFVTDDPDADRVFGVLDSDTTIHPLIEFDEDTSTVLTGDFDESDPFNDFPNQVEEEYVRLAWETGGSAWNIHAIQGGATDPERAFFSDEFAKAFAARALAQDPYIEGELEFAVNFGGPTTGMFSDTVAGLVGTSVTTTFGIDLTSGSVPISPAEAQQVFSSAIEAANGSDLNIPITVPNGRYAVELYFSEIDTNDDRVFDVKIEGATVLNDYDISEDYSSVQLVATPGSADINMLESYPAGFNNGAVKVWTIDVTDGQLNIDLEDEGGIQGPLLNALRISNLTAKAPRVEDVVLIGRRDGVITEVRMSDLVAVGKQLNDIDLGSVEDVRIEFDRPTVAQESDLEILPLIGSFATTPQITGFSREPTGMSATWGFTPLPSNFFALRLNSSTVLSQGLALDGEWFNPGNLNEFSGPSGSPVTNLLSGDGSAGGDFIFAFTVFSADFNGDYLVDILDLDILSGNFGSAPPSISLHYGDANGDGLVDILDLDILSGNFGSVWESLDDLLIDLDYDGDGDVDQDDRLGVAGFDQLFDNEDALADLNNDGEWDDIDQALFDLFADIQVN